jgi:DNA helicase-2/ATP-dependent DNA helicase PcrA
MPHLSGLETAEYLLKTCVREQNNKENLLLTYVDFFGARSLITQLLRRYRLMCENLLSFEDLLNRSKEIGQDYSIQANESLKCLKLKTSKLRVLDFVSQMNAFLMLLKQKEVQLHFKQIQHLLVDDIDETIPVCQHFIKYLLPNLQTFVATCDPDGGTRRGYQSAYPAGCEEIKQISKVDSKTLNSMSPLKQTAENLYQAIKTYTPVRLSNIKLNTSVSRIEMLDNLTQTLDDLIYDQDISIEDIILVTPSADSAIKQVIQDYCQKNGLLWQFLSGSNKPIENPRVYGAVILAQLINAQWKMVPGPFEIRLMLMGILDFPALIAEKIAEEYEKTYKKNPLLPNLALLDANLKDHKQLIEKYQHLVSTVEAIKTDENRLYNQLVRIFADLIAPTVLETESVEDFNQVLDSLYDFLSLKEKVKKHLNLEIKEKEWFLQVKNEVVAENPVTPADILPGTLVIATPQKLADIKLVSQYQLWLDVSSTNWTRTQTAPLYNAWAYSNYFDGSEYDDLQFTHSIASHLLRSLVYHCTKEVIALASTYDSRGYEQTGWLIKYLNQNTENTKPARQIILREDQAPILEYKRGTMAVAAVPGSGKTFVNVALISKLIEEDIHPENILVLTYMESAARTLINRIKSIFPNLSVLPMISTIHGLAYKIIRDEDNLAKLGLNEDLDVADESVKPAILNAVADITLPDGEMFESWHKYIEKGIATAKSLDLKPVDIARYLKYESSSILREFYEPYRLYTRELELRNLIDFDDQIRYAIKLLKTFPEVKKRYQMRYSIIIEDEAQDSTILQQELLSLLVGNSKNYIRTGDVNQAIMTTFTPVDVEGYRKFIDEADTVVKMDQSQRCAEPVYSLANELIDWAQEQTDLANAFLNIKMKPVLGKNPQVKDSVTMKIFDTSDSEMSFIAKKLNELKSKMPSATFAVLVRTNYEAIKWTHHLSSLGFDCICFTDNLKQRKVFNIIHSYLKVLHKPYNNKNVKTLYDTLVETEYLSPDTISQDFIYNLGSPFLSFDTIELPTSQLVQLYMDLFYWLEYAHLPVSELILKMTCELFTDPIDRSNGYILSIVAERHRREISNSRYRENFTGVNETDEPVITQNFSVGLPEIIKEFDRLVRLKKVKGFKFFEKEESDESRAGFVQIMTVHKAKGMGFDVVCVPHIWENRFSYCTTKELINVDLSNRLEHKLNELAGKKVNQEAEEERIKQNQVEETLRLLYVAITRARKYLFLTSSKQNAAFKREEKPSRVLEELISKRQATKEKVKH